MFVADFMTTGPTTVSAKAHLAVARRLMSRGSIRHLPVVDENQVLLGLVTARQILSAPAAAACGDIMISNPTTVRRDTTLMAALRLTCEHHLSALPVVSEDGTLEGIITRGDILSATHRLLGPDFVVGCFRNAGAAGPAFYVRVPQQNAGVTERAVSPEELTLLLPQRERSDAVSAGNGTKQRKPSRPWSGRKLLSVRAVPVDAAALDRLKQVVDAVDSSVYLG